MRAVWDTLIVAPPLVIRESEIDELVEKARLTLDQLRDALHRDGLV
jgi:putrescine aminotransferase